MKNRPGENEYDYTGGAPMAQYPTQQQPQQQTWKYTPPAVPQTTQSTSTKDWNQFVNNQGITNWEDHLRSQGIDPLVSVSAACCSMTATVLFLNGSLKYDGELSN